MREKQIRRNLNIFEQNQKNKNQLHLNKREKISVFPVPVASMDENNAITKDTVCKSVINHRDVISNLLQRLRTIERLQSMHDVDRVNSIIDQLNLHLPGPVTPQKLCRFDICTNTDWELIAENEYAAIQCELIRLFDNNWPIKSAADNMVEPNVVQLFSIDHSFNFVKTTLSNIFDKEHVAKFGQLMRIFEHCIQTETWLLSAFVDMCMANDEIEARPNRKGRDDFIQLLIAAPNKIANYFMGKHSSLFDSEHFSCILLLALIQTIYFIAEMNKVERRVLFSAKLLGQLLGRIAVDFHLDRTSKTLPEAFQIISILATKSDDLKSCVREMMLNIPRQSYDIVAFYILNTSNPVSILGNALEISSDWQFLLKTKLPLSTPKGCPEQFIRNLIEVLVSGLSVDEGCCLLEDVAKAWSSRLSIKSHSIEQHIYLTKLLIIGVERFELGRNNNHTGKLSLVIHNGVKNHMETLDEKIRAIGMITAEIILNKLNNHSDEESKLRFEYDGFTKEVLTFVDDIKKLNESIEAKGQPPIQGDLDSSISALYQIRESDGKGKEFQIEKKAVMSTTVKNTIEIGSLPPKLQSSASAVLVKPKIDLIDEDDLDSDDDDDLQPYDMSNDTPLVQDKRPQYLRDLREALIHTDDPEVFEQSIIACASLVETRLPGDQSRIGVELLRVLIELDQRFYMEDFDFHRMSACVAICCIIPKDGAEYLCEQIHTEVGRYSIGKKVLMMDILGESAKALSQIDRTAVKPSSSSKPESVEPKRLKLIDETDDTYNRLNEAKRIIAERIEKKSRRFAQPSKSILSGGQVNKFADVAGHFLFPLLYGFGKEELTLYGRETALKHDTDNILLLCLLRTVATITLAAQNCPIISKITPEVLQLGTVLRFHSESRVRLAVLQMLAAALLATPKSLLQLHFSNYLLEIKIWLEEYLSLNIIKGEKNAECREMARNVMAVCLDALTVDP